MRKTLIHTAIPLAAAALLTAGAAWADGNDANDQNAQAGMQNGSAMNRGASTGNMNDAQKQVTEATRVVGQMKRDPHVAELLQRARGVFIVPDYAKAGVVVGGRGGGGVVLVKRGGKWSNPAFFNFGSVSVGPQAGVAAGSMAMLLMSDKAVDMFENQANNFSLNANADFTIVNYSATAQGNYGKGDVIVWSDTEGAFAGANIAVSDINRDEDENHAYYGKQVSAKQILTGEVKEMHAENLRDALATRVASK